MNNGWRLSIVLQLVLLTVMLAAIVVMLVGGYFVAKKELLNNTKVTAQGATAQLTNLAGHLLESNPQIVAEATAMLATDPLIRLAAVITPDEQVRYATSTAAQGRSVNELYGYSRALFDRAQQQDNIIIEASEDGLGFIAVASYTAAVGIDRIRSQSRGVIYLAYDLNPGLYQLLLHTFEKMLPEIMALLVMSLVFSVFLNRFVTVPLGNIEKATLAIESGDYDVRLDPLGPQEIRLLTHRLNQMSAQLKKTKEALDFQVERMRLVIKGTNDGIWDWNILTKDDYLSPRWKEIVGYRDEELENVESTFVDLIYPDDMA